MSQSATAMSVRRASRVIKGFMNFQPEGWGDAKEAGRQALRRTLEEGMARQVRRYLSEALGRGIPDRRNGSYRRHLLTAMGDIELVVPRTRQFSAVSVVRAYARRTEDVDRSILACFVLGLSTRKVAEALLPLFGERVSASTVSRVAKTLDEEVTAFHRRPLRDRYSVLQFDGVVLSRKTGVGVRRRPVLVALGIRPDGRKEIIDFLLAPAESQAAWEGLLNDLYRRGLQGQAVEMITIDGCAGLAAALATVYPRARVQRCWAHKVRNLLDRARKGDREEMKRGLRCIYGARTRLKACHQVIRFGHRWEVQYPRAVRSLAKDIEELLAFYDFRDSAWRKTTRTTNAIERRFREVRRRTRPMGVFSDRTSIERILYAVFSHLNRGQGAATPFPLTQNT